ncbi:MAG: hypothetical protein PF569_09710 [Candidatus Woesearchaeota archaeon]|jgi:flagellin-like protein|nr:hypothetical protein [Candidatus Woesearchaeota archaeon]
MVFNKKAISPVVATALLLVVAVVAVVGFQQWFQTYNSGLMAGVDEQSATSSGITVEMVQNSSADAIVFLKNPSTNAVTADISISECPTATGGTDVSITPGINTSGYTLTTCGIDTGAKVTVVIKTDEAIYRESEIVSN